MEYLLAGITIILGVTIIYCGVNKKSLTLSSSDFLKEHPILYRIIYLVVGTIVTLFGLLSIIGIIKL